MAKGKPGSSPLLRPDADAVSLHSTHGASGSGTAAFLDDDAPELFLDNDELPPLYTDVVNGGADEENGNTGAGGRAAAAPGGGDAIGNSYYRITTDVSGEPKPWRYDIGYFGDENPGRELALVTRSWAQVPPRPYVQLKGTHSQTVDNNGKKEKKDVVDFDVKVELTPYLFSDVTMNKSWKSIHTAWNHEKVRRGTVFKHQAPEYVDAFAAASGSGSGPVRLPDNATVPGAIDANANANANANAGDLERGATTIHPSDQPSLEEWCRRYSEDPAKLRAFQLERRMVGFDKKAVRTKLEALVRRTNYRGHLQITFPIDEVGQVYYSPHRFNQWRMSRWIQALCVLTLMIIFTWPYLFFATKRYEVVTVEWPFSRLNPQGEKEYISLSEEQWYNMWARAINKAVMGKRQATLDQEDLRSAEGADPTFESTGNSTVDGAMGFVRAGISAMNGINRQLGWGGDC